MKALAREHESGGSMRGGYAQLSFDREMEKISLVTQGFYGGFVGYAPSNRILRYENNELIEDIQFRSIRQVNRNFNYNDAYLQKNAHLLYSNRGTPFSKNTIQQAEYLKEYTINDDLVTQDAFRYELDRVYQGSNAVKFYELNMCCFAGSCRINSD